MNQRPKTPRTVVESLESRRLLSVAPASLLDNGYEQMQWGGKTVYARPDQWIAKVDGLKGAAAKQLRVLNGAVAASNAGGVKAVRHLGKDGLVLLKAAEGRSFKQVQHALASSTGLDVAALEPDFAVWTTATPNDPLYGPYNWGLNNTGQTGGKADADIDAPEAWNTTTGNGSVVVGVIDSGVDYTHPDLTGNMWRNPGEIAGNSIDDDRNGYTDDVYGWDFFNNDSNPMDDNGHGTHVAGTIAASGNNGIGVAGVAWNAKVMALKFLGADGSGSMSAALAAINYATKMRTQYGINVRVTNNSWGGGGYSSSLFNAINQSAQAGILFVAAAGNGGADGIGDNNDVTPEYPASYNVANVLSVAATDHNDNLATFSNYGANWVDLAAPGVNIASTAAGGGYVYMSGTSMATPHVSGAAALAFSHNPSATYQQVRSALMNGVDKLSNLTGKMVSGGRLNAHKTLLNMAPPVTLPAAPSALAAAAVSAGQVNLTWTDNSNNESGFKIERRTGTTGTWAQVATVAAGTTSWQDTGLTALTRYDFRIRAYNSAGDSAYSGVASATTRGQYTNLALGKKASQTTTGWGGLAEYAVDGNTDGAFFNYSVTHTEYEAQPSWQVDLGSSAWIDRLELWNRLDGASGRLQNFYVIVSDNVLPAKLSDALAQPGVSTYYSAGYPDPSSSIAVGRTGRYVRVQLAGEGYLSLAEVKAFGEALQPAVVDQNLAVGKAATQSTTAYGGAASHAVDGNTDGQYFNWSVTHTSLETQPWWQVDLGASASISNIEVWNRLDGASGRLQNFHVLVSDTPFVSGSLSQVLGQSGVTSYFVKNIPNPNTTVMVGRTGRYVRIQLAGTEHLSLAEVKVNGSFVSASTAAQTATPSTSLASLFSRTAVQEDRAVEAAGLLA